MKNYGPNNEKLPKELSDCLHQIIQSEENQDSYIRKQQVRIWKKYDRFWHGVQYIWWSETQQDWISPIDSRWDNTNDSNREGAEGPFYDYVINIYKAEGESIIAALSAQMPTVRFPPDDADNEDDVLTSKVYSKVSDLIIRHNQGKLLLFSALLALWNQGIVCAYHAPKADPAFGNVKIPTWETQNLCEACQRPGDPGDCQSCAEDALVNNSEGPIPQVVPTPVQTGFQDAPKTRVLVDIFGPLFVRVPYFSREQKDFGYLHLTLEQPISHLKSLYPHVADKIDSASAGADTYERVARSPSTFAYAINDQTYLGTLKRCWIRPWEFESLGEEFQSEKDQLYELFPDGCFVTFIGDVYAESRNECMDEYWTVGKGGLSTYIHSDAVGQPLVPLQEEKNVLNNLTLETIEQGISIVYADPETIDFEDYSRHEQRPGMIVPAKPKPGARLADSFFEGPKASLSKDVSLFEQQIEKDSQFVVGAFPSIYGGPSESSSRTAAEYNMSRQMALQRLSITWTLLTHWWAKLMDKCVRLYVKNLVADDRYVVNNKGNYVNVWIRQSELRGKVGEVEPEGAETFPTSMTQKQDLLFKLMTLNNEWVNAALFDPENRKIIADALAFPELHIPDEDQRIKQARETEIMSGGVMVQIEPDVDNDEVHIGTLRDFLVSEEGMNLKVTNAEGYGYCVMHLKAHIENQATKSLPSPNPLQQVNPQPV